MTHHDFLNANCPFQNKKTTEGKGRGLKSGESNSHQQGESSSSQSAIISKEIKVIKSISKAKGMDTSESFHLVSETH